MSLLNAECIDLLLSQGGDVFQKYAVPSVQGFFRSIALSRDNSLQDTLRLLTLWFDYGQVNEVYEALVEGIKTIQIDTWLQVSTFHIRGSIFPFYIEILFYKNCIFGVFCFLIKGNCMFTGVKTLHTIFSACCDNCLTLF